MTLFIKREIDKELLTKHSLVLGKIQKRMKIEIENKSQFGWFSIKYNDSSVGCFTKVNEPFKINYNKSGGSQTEMNNYSLTELEKIILIILNSYIFSHERLEKMINCPTKNFLIKKT